MKDYAKIKDIEDITGLELKDALMELYYGMPGAAAGFRPVCKTTLQDGTEAQVFIKITTDDEEMMD